MNLKHAGVLCLVFLLGGTACSVRRHGSSAYRLVRVGSRPVLLTPAVPDNLDSSAPVTLRWLRHQRASAPDASSPAICFLLLLPAGTG